MARRRAAGLLLALAACIATATAAPTASNHTSLDLYDGAPEGCYYNFQHYGEGDRIMTNEPCLNCTCHNRMLMCYLKVCPFTKAIGQDCTIEKRADQCCPIVTCPDVPVDLLTSTTTSPAEYGPTGMGKLDKFGCSIHGKYFSEGSKVPAAPNKPCEHCYCIRNMTTCVMQECTLHVDGCTPIYHKDVCCPVRYSCDHPEDEMPLLDDLSTTVRPTPGFLLTTTTVAPVTQMSQDCVYENQIFPDGALIKTEKACDHCYCMKGDIVCVVQECGTPMENEGKNCTALRPREGVCCPDTYICEGDEPTTGTIDAYERTTIMEQDEVTSLSPPRRTGSEGSGYRNEPDEVYTESPAFEPEVEGSGEEEESKRPAEIIPESATPGLTDDMLSITEVSHEYIPLTTSGPASVPEITTASVFDKDIEKITSSFIDDSLESHSTTPSKIDEYTVKESVESVTDAPQSHEIGSGEPVEHEIKPDEAAQSTPSVPVIEEHDIITEASKQDITTNAPVYDEITSIPQEPITSDIDVKETTISSIISDITISSQGESVKPTQTPNVAESTDLLTQHTTMSTLIAESDNLATTKLPEPSISTDVTVNGGDVEPQVHVTSSSVSNLDDEFITTETPELEQETEKLKESQTSEPPKHVTTHTPMLEEIERDTTEYTGIEHSPSDVTQDDGNKIFSTIIPHIPSDTKTTTIVAEQTVPEDNILGTTEKYDDHEATELHKIPEVSTETNVAEDFEDQKHTPKPSTTISQDSESGITIPEETPAAIEDVQSTPQDFSKITTVSTLETEYGTTEPDKGLNTIPSGTLEDDISGSNEQKTTIYDEKLTTESEISNKYGDDIEQQPITESSISSVNGVDSSTLTTESAFRKEDDSPFTSQENPELTTVRDHIPKDEISTIIEDYAKTTEPALDMQHDITTTSSPLSNVNLEDTTEAKDDAVTSGSYLPESVPEKETRPEEETTTGVSNENIPQTTEANQEDNEIFNEPRIPGEGDCLLNGITYTNESAVPSSNKCQSGCKCISSIIKCDPILCSPPPQIENCETIYDSPDACCPTYVCDHKSETIPPQSHSQMSGTESPIDSPITCQGDECVIKKPSSNCESGVCPSQIGSDIPEKPVIDEKQDCLGDKCGPIICTDENGCQAKPCEGENCNIAPSVPVSQSCANGEDCNIQNIPSKDCSAGDCGSSDAQSDDTQPKETCSDEGDCQKIPVSDVSAIDHNISEQCSGTDCKKPQMDVEISTPSIIEHSSPQQDLVKDSEEKTESETSTIKSDHIDQFTSSDHPASHGTQEPQPEEEPEKPITTSIEPVTELDLVTQNVDVTTRPTSVYTEEDFSTEEPDTSLDQTDKPVSSGTVLEEMETKVPIMDEISSEQPQMFVTPSEHEIKTEQPDVTNVEITTKKPTQDRTTEPTKTLVSQPQTDLDESAIHASSEATIEPTSYSPQSYDLTSPLDENLSKNTEESISEPDKKVSDTTIESIESSTEQPLEYVTKPQKEESITETSKPSIETAPTDVIKEVQPESSTEPTKLITSDAEATTVYKQMTPSMMESSSTASSVYEDDSQGITSTPIINEKESTTAKEKDEIPLEEAPAVTESGVENTSEPAKQYVTESLDITKSPEGMMDKDITPSITHYDTPKEDFGNEPSKTENIATESVEKATTEFTSEEPFSEPPKSDSSKPDEIPITLDNGNQEDTSETPYGAATEPPKTVSSEPQDIPVSTEGTFQEPASTIETESMTTIPEVVVTKSDQEAPSGSEDAGYEETTSKISDEPIATTSTVTHSTERVEQQSLEESDRDHTTEKVSEEPVTKTSTSLESEPQEVTTSPAEEQETFTTLKSYDETVTTETLSNGQVPEINDVGTTIKVAESVTEPSRAPETVEEHATESTETSTPSVIDIVTDKPTVMQIPEDDEEKIHAVEVTPDIITTPEEHLTSESVETTPPTLPEKSEEITTHTQESHTDLGGVTDTPIKEQTITTSSSLIEGIQTTISPIIIGSEQPLESLPGDVDLEKRPESDSHITTLKPVTGQEDESQPDIQETLSTQPKPVDVIVEDDLRTTISEKHDLTTSKPIEATKEPSEIEIKTEHPITYTPQEEPLEATDELSTDTKKPEDALKTELPSGVTVSILPTVFESTTEIYSDKPAIEIDDRYSSDKTTSGHDTTSVYIDEVAATEQPVAHRTDEPTKLENNKDVTLTTEKQEFDKDYPTQVPVQVSSDQEGDITHMPDQDKVETTSPASNLPDIESESTEKTVTVTSDDKPAEEELITEYPVLDKTTSDDIREKDHLPDDSATPIEPSLVPEQFEPTTTISSTKISSVETTTAREHSINDMQSSDIKPTESSSPTETSEVMAISEDHTLEPQQGISETDLESTQAPEIHDDTKPSEYETPETSSQSSVTEEALGIEKQTTVSEEQHTISLDHGVTEAPESFNKETLLPTTTTLSEQESSVSTSKPLEEVEQAIKEDDVISGDKHTTETLRVTETSTVSQLPGEKEPELFEIVTPQKETTSEDSATTIQPHKPDEFDAITTQSPVTSVELQTTLSDTSIAMEQSTPAQLEQFVPVVISDEDKTSSPKETDLVQTERVTQATDKPLHETTAPEEEFILATSKAPTTVKVEEEASTVSPSIETTAKSTDRPVETITAEPELPKPVSTEPQPTEESPIPDEEGSFPPSGTSGYGQEPDYVEEDQTFGPGTCRYGGKVYVSAQQIPRDDPCDFCFCFRSDIICLQQSCPPPIHGCHEEPIQGFCCPRYECPVSMATTVNVTTTTTTTTTTLPPHFPTHSYKGSAQRRGCQIKGHTYKVGEVVRASSGPCLHCTCGGDGQMKCDPKVCTPEPMLRQMIAAAVSAKRRR